MLYCFPRVKKVVVSRGLVGGLGGTYVLTIESGSHHHHACPRGAHEVHHLASAALSFGGIKRSTLSKSYVNVLGISDLPGDLLELQ